MTRYDKIFLRGYRGYITTCLGDTIATAAYLASCFLAVTTYRFVTTGADFHLVALVEILHFTIAVLTVGAIDMTIGGTAKGIKCVRAYRKRVGLK